MKPKIRVKGFEDEWRSSTLGSFGSVEMCKRIFKDQTSDYGEVPFFKIGTFGNAPDAYISRALYNEYKSKFSYPKKGDILISAAGTIGRTIEYHGEDAYFQDSNIVWLKHNKELDNSFLKHLYSVISWKGLEGATIKRLYNNIILETEINIPCINEQKAIASYFQGLDGLIEATAKKIESLKRVKAASLQSMFPQEGETTPRLRFKGFSNEWEMKKFSELYEPYSIKNKFFGEDKIISVANMYFRPVNYVSNEEYLKSYNVMKLGDIAFEGNKSKNFAHGRFVENTIGDGIVSHVFVVLTPKSEFYDLQFWKYLINYERIMGPILMRSTKHSTMMTDLVVSDFLKESILVPSYEEQKAIGSFFANLDSQISLQTQRLEKLKQIKAACLDNMFV